MPVSKKPRKGRDHRRPPLSALWVTPKAIARLRQIFIDLNLHCLAKLHRGLMDKDDIACLRDAINLARIGIISRTWIDFEDSAEAVGMVQRTAEAFESFYQRWIDTGKATCTGDELRAFNDGIPVLIDFILDSLDVYPHRVLKEFWGMKQLVDGAAPGTVSVTERQIMQALRTVR